jgi:REP element-mobilizing transposase RayT
MGDHIMTAAAQTTSFWRGHLPHWEVADGSYFITLRVAGSLPRSLHEELSELVNGADTEALRTSRRYFVKLEAWLDHDRTHPVLAQPDIARSVLNAIEGYADRGMWSVHSAVVMPNHAHMFVTPIGVSLRHCMQRFKRLTSTQINHALTRTGTRVWQTEWFDHWSRSSQESDRIISYIRNNPVKAGLVASPEEWPYLI